MKRLPYGTVSHRERHKAERRTEGMSLANAVAERIRLRTVIRTNRQAVSGSLLSLSVPEWSPVREWQAAIKCPYNRTAAAAKRQLQAIEQIFPTPDPWKPRPANKADARIAKLYKPAIAATPINWRFFGIADANFYRERHEHKHRRQTAAIEKREWLERRTRQDAEVDARRRSVAA